MVFSFLTDPVLSMSDDRRSAERRLLEHTVQKFLTGDSAQFQIIRAKISQYVHHQVANDRIEPDDVVSEVIKILYKSLKDGRFRGDSLTALSAYIYSIVRNESRRTWHRVRRIVLTPDPQEVPAPDHGQEVELSDYVARIFAGLDEQCRKLLELKFCEGWIDQEIADEEGKTKNAISTAISRCLKKARKLALAQDLR